MSPLVTPFEFGPVGSRGTYAIGSVAVVLTLNGAVCTDARIVLGAVGPAPVRDMAAEAILIGHPISPELAFLASEVALAGAKALSANSYKI